MNIMLATFEHLVDWLCGHQTEPSEPEPEPPQQSRWAVDVPARNALRLGTFRTREEALDYRREYIVRAIREIDPIELPF